MFNNQKFVKVFIIIIGVFLLYHLSIWSIFTSKIFGRTDGLHVGDLGRMSYQVNMLKPRKLEHTLQKKHINKTNWNNQKIDIITIGDSFFNAGGGGKNPYFQDYLATIHDKNVLNIQNYKNTTMLETIVGLYNNGTLNKLKPKVIIIESIQRELVSRFTKDIDFSFSLDTNTIKDLLEDRVDEKVLPSVLQINTANYKLAFYYFKYMNNINAVKEVYKFNLNKNMFSSKTSDELLVYHDDIKRLNHFNANSIKKINDTLNKLAEILKTLHIKLIFMPVVDKYDLYFDFIEDNAYPKNSFFTLIRKMEKNYYFVDTKKILLPLLEEKDIYYPDDTHWSYKASEILAEDIMD